jgi:AcrR family transcriptional regulator
VITQRAQQKQETRLLLLDAATRLMGENGFAGTRTADVAADIGLSHGTLFVHFPRREDLLLEVVNDLGRRLTDRLHAMAGEGLREALLMHVRCLAEEEALYTRFLRERHQLPESCALAWLGIQSAVAHHLMRAAEGEKLVRTPLHLLFGTWVGLVHHYLMNRELYAPKGSVLKKLGRELVDHFLKMARRER